MSNVSRVLPQTPRHGGLHRFIGRCAIVLLASVTMFMAGDRVVADTATTAPAAIVPTAPATTSPAFKRSGNGKLLVLVKPAEPFSFENEGQKTGYSVELWKAVAEKAGLQFEMEMVPTMPLLIEALKKGEADVGVGAISVTEDREKFLDFSHPFFQSGLQIMAPASSSGSAFSVFGSLFRGDVLMVISIFLIAIFGVSNILWFTERKVNPECFPAPYKAGVWEATWWAACTIISGGCENKAANSVAGRLVAIVWMLGGIGLTSYITATLASAMTVNTLTSDIRDIADLKGQVVATVAGSSSETFLKGRGFNPESFENYSKAIDALNKKDVKAVVYDSPMLRYYLTKHADSPLQLAGDMFDLQNYAFAMPLGSPHRKRINEAILQLDKEGFRNALEKKWFNSKSN
jgi:polar amino acid transport system substrate-binding protein